MYAYQPAHATPRLASHRLATPRLASHARTHYIANICQHVLWYISVSNRVLSMFNGPRDVMSASSEDPPIYPPELLIQQLLT